jgi:hypothetical protein
LVGLLIGALFAAIALAGIWLTLYAASGFTDPSYAGAVGFGISGIVIYPACWYLWICRARDYSRARTFWLVAVTYTATAMLAIGAFFLFMAFSAIYGAILGATTALSSGPQLWHVGMLLALVMAPILAALGGILMAGLVGVPYVIVATPIAFLHRALMFKLFAQPATAAAQSPQQNGPVATGP